LGVFFLMAAQVFITPGIPKTVAHDLFLVFDMLGDEIEKIETERCQATLAASDLLPAAAMAIFKRLEFAAGIVQIAQKLCQPLMLAFDLKAACRR
jgi:hypothetical protein